MDLGSLAFERYSASNIADNNKEDTVLNNEDAISESADHARLDHGGGEAGPVATHKIRGEESSRQQRLGNNWQSCHDKKNYQPIDLVSLVDESITKPVMEQIMKGWGRHF